MQLLSSTRSALWWNHMILPWTFWVYLVAFQEPGLFQAVSSIVHITIGLSTVCILGYLINDYFDRSVDELAGKANFFQNKSKYHVLLIPAMMLLEGLVWYFLPITPISIALLCFQVLLLLMYSMPPIRLKVRGAGVLADATYTRVLPALIILSISPLWREELLWVIVIGSLWMLMVGLRNILAHQLDDFGNDAQSGFRTFVHRFDGQKMQNFILWFILPIELALSAVALVLLSEFAPGLYWSMLAFLLFLIARFNLWRVKSWSLVRWRSLLLYLPNNLYDDFLPLIILVILGLKEPLILLGIPVHLLLFPKVWKKIWADSKSAIANTWAYIRFLGLKFYLGISFLFNLLVYRVFLLFNIDLKKENLSMIGYLKKRFSK